MKHLFLIDNDLLPGHRKLLEDMVAAFGGEIGICVIVENDHMAAMIEGLHGVERMALQQQDVPVQDAEGRLHAPAVKKGKMLAGPLCEKCGRYKPRAGFQLCGYCLRQNWRQMKNDATPETEVGKGQKRNDANKARIRECEDAAIEKVVEAAAQKRGETSSWDPGSHSEHGKALRGRKL